MIDLNCDGAYDSNDVELPFANRDVKDVYLKISWMAQSPFTYAYVDTNVCPAQTVFAFEPRDHKPDAESVNAVVAAFSGAHVQQEFLRCTADVDCASLQNHSCARLRVSAKLQHGFGLRRSRRLALRLERRPGRASVSQVAAARRGGVGGHAAL